MELLSVSNFIIRSAVISSILICLILLIRLLLGRRLNPDLKYCIWMLLMLRLLIPYAPQSPVSIYNLFPFTGHETRYVLDLYGINTESGARTAAAPASQDSLASGGVNPEKPAAALFVLWATGVLSFGLYTGTVNIRFGLKLLSGSKVITGPEYTKLLQECGQRLGIRKKLRLAETDAVKAPALYGLVRPRLLLPVDGCRSYGAHRLKYVFLHELAHMKRLDNYAGVLMRVLQAVYWFNPLLWLAFHIMRDDREKACDSRVLTYLKPEEHKNYGETLIYVLQGCTGTARLPAITAMAGGRQEIRERISLVARYGEKTGIGPMLALAGFLLLGSIVLTDSLPSYAAGGVNTARYANVLTDRIDYPFVNDAELVGRWQSVDFVQSIDDFIPSVKTRGESLYLHELVLDADGKTSVSTSEFPLRKTPYIRWTDGLILHLGDKTAAKYFIKEIDGDTFLFMEWKSGDYTIRKMKPYYYVLKKVI